MIPYLGCDAAREMLEAFVDGELAMADQVLVESHLRWCRTCGARVEDIDECIPELFLGHTHQPEADGHLEEPLW